MIPSFSFSTNLDQTSKSMPVGLGLVASIARTPTDPLFYSAITLNNIVAGSRYRLALNDGTELAKGTAADTTVTVSSVPVYANPQLVRLDVRFSSGSTKYIPLVVYAYQIRTGASFYVSQVLDTVAQ